MNTMIKIREATTEDAARLVEIYSYYVLNTAVSFEYEVPSVEEFTDLLLLRMTILSDMCMQELIAPEMHIPGRWQIQYMWIKTTEDRESAP